MKKRLRVGVIFGGRSGEHEISLLSARAIMAAMDPAKYEIVPIGITHDGRWLLTGDPMAVLSAADGHEAGAAESTALVRKAPLRRELVPGATGSTLPLLDVIFPVLHGPYGEDGTVQGLLELADLPYVGSGVLASSLAMDKVASKTLLRAHGLPVVAFWPVKRSQWEAEPDRVIADVEARLRYPLFVKPANLGSSIGVNKARDRAQLRAALDEAARYDRKLLVEEAVPNAREIECSVLGNDDPEASVPGEIVPCNEFYDYAAKYLDGRSALLIPAPLTKEQTAQVRALSLRAFQALDAAGLARVDFLMDGASGALYLSEVNTMPGFTAISMYPKLWEASGLPYPELVDRLIELALERHAEKSRVVNRYAGARPEQR